MTNNAPTMATPACSEGVSNTQFEFNGEATGLNLAIRLGIPTGNVRMVVKRFNWESS